jgi:hypothetical protein
MQKYVDINGIQVLDVTPDYNRPLALVDLTVLNKLTLLLQKDTFSNIRHNFREQIMQTNNLAELVEASEDFIAFHRTVNLIREVCQENVNQINDEPVGVLGHIDLDDIDTCGRDHNEY